jgi:hypothetical protein
MHDSTNPGRRGRSPKLGPGVSGRRSVRGCAAALGAAAAGTAQVAALASPALAATAQPVGGHFGFTGAGEPVVFVQTDNTTGNEVVAYHRSPSGALTEAGSYRTSGLGGQLAGSVAEQLSSQGSLGLDPTMTPQFTHAPGQVAFSPNGSHLIVTTKANDNDIDVFAVTRGGRLSAASVVNSEPGDLPSRSLSLRSAILLLPRPESTRS